MLKGLKKIIPEKSQEISQNIQSKYISDLAVLQQNAMKLYLNGTDSEVIQIQLQKIKKLQDQYFEIVLKQSIENIKQMKYKRDNKYQYDYDYEQDQHQQKKKKNKKKTLNVISDRKVQQCFYCPQNQEITMLSASNFVYLGLPKLKTFRKYWHLILAPIQHQQTTIGMQDNILQEIRNYQKCLLRMFDQMDLHVIFFQQFYQPNSHIYIQCLAIPLTKGQDLPFFFKQALETVQGNWNTHKNIIEIRKEKGGLQKQIPKQMKYFYIDFSLGYGYAHVIENQKQWQKGFCYQILATGLGLQQHQIKTTEDYMPEQLSNKTNEFQKIWKQYDWTILI